MTDWIDELPLDDDLQLDLLVDNELNEAQRQRLLTSLEGEPERWRALALRFAEGQMLTSGVQRWAAETSNTATPARTFGGHLKSNRSRWFMVLAVCAAFGCGLAVESWRSGADGRNPLIVETTPADRTEDREQQNVLPMPDDEPVARPRNSVPPRREMARRRLSVPLRLVQTSAGSQEWSPRVRLTPSRKLALHQSGVEVQRRPGTVRVPLGGDRHVMMPAQHLQFVRRVRYRI